ncbi:hypothetical protein [Microbacterium sp. 22242]|uniref:hypothetical protein n=1 Tax=Microbacterium sp. 22242 TaxID=3453896 RepID=UPI003F851C84
MTGRYDGASAEQEWEAIGKIEDWRIPEATSLQLSLSSLDSALKALVEAKDAWQGTAGDTARAQVAEMRTKFARIEKIVGVIVDAIDTANTSRRSVLSGAELPSGSVPPFWVNLIKTGGTVVYPGLGPLPADTALTTITDHLAGQREQAAQAKVEAVRTAMQEPTQKIAQARQSLMDPNYVYPPVSTPPADSGSGGGGGYPGAPGGGGGGYPGGPYIPGGGGGLPGGGNGGGLTGGPDYPPYSPIDPGDGTDPGDRPTIDDPDLRGHVPGGGGTGGSGLGPMPAGGVGGSVPGGLLGGAAGGGGAAALAFGVRGGLAGFRGGASLSALKPGGLLGSGTTGGLGGAGGAGSGAAEGATGMGSRSGGGMVGGQGGAASGEAKKRAGHGSDGPIAPHLEDDEEPIARSKSAGAGSRDEPAPE